jgi:hypothetical protein
MRHQMDDAELGRARIVIGCRERVSLPDWGIHGITAKVDTGARTSAIHVDCIEIRPDGVVRFEVVTGRGRVPVEAPMVRLSLVRPSTGKQQQRPVVQTRVRIGPLERVIEIGLVCRRRMLRRMLLGRSALRGRFLIDPGRARVLTPRKN